MQDARHKTISFSEFIERLRKELENLPGEAAQYRMSPQFRMKPEEERQYYPTARLSAVLILFYPVNDDIYTVLIQRPSYEGVHSGQVAFPGGKKEAFDIDLIATALREANEEVGVDPKIVEVIKPLTQLYIPPSNFLVTPVVGFSHEHPQFVGDHHEVQEVLEVNINLLIDDSLAGTKMIQARPGVEFESPYFNINGRTVWGATAMMISELREILKRVFMTTA